MATYRSIDTYRDPEKASIANNLGQGMTYLQRNYDENTLQTQALVDKYINTDLLRDVDKQYLGERLTTLTNYVNQSGTKNWTKKSVAKDIENYIGTAIDQNVLAAVSSTQAYRKQAAEIEAYKKAGKGEYAAQNEWLATRDLQRYMKSTELGDTYRAGTYMPYRNVSEKILKNADKLKEFGVEYSPFEGSNNGLFRMIGTKETLSPQKVQQYLGAILDAGDLQQIQIDGQYSMKDNTVEEVKEKYDGLFDKRISALENNINAYKVQLPGASSKEKEAMKAKIAEWEEEKANYDVTKQKSLTKESMISTYYMSNFMENYSDFLSFDRAKDFKIDDSMFQLKKYQTDMQFKELERADKLAMNQADRILAQQKMAQDAYFKGAKLNEDGSVSVDPNNPYYNASVGGSGISVQDEITPQDKKEIVSPFAKEESAWMHAYETGVNTIESGASQIFDKPGNEDLKKSYGGSRARDLMGALVNAPSKMTNLYNALTPEMKLAVDTARSRKKAMSSYDDDIRGITTNVTDKVAASMLSNKTKDTAKAHFAEASFGLTINDDGKLVQGNVLEGKGNNQKLARELTALNLAIDEAPRNSDQREVMERAFRLKVAESNLTGAQKQEVMRKMMFTQNAQVGILNDVASAFGGLATFLGKAWRGESTEGVRSNIAESTGNQISWGRETGRDAANILNRNENIGSYGTSSFGGTVDKDIDVEDPSLLGTTLSTHLANINNKIAKRQENVLSTSINIDSGDKNNKALMSGLKLAIPQGVETVADSSWKITNIDRNAGTADVTVVVKGKKENTVETFPVPIANLPPQLIQRLDSTKNPVYSASNTDAIGYSQTFEIPKTQSDRDEIMSHIPIEQRMSGNVPNYPTQTEMAQSILMSAPPELVKKHATEIQDILEASYNVNLIPVQGQWVAQVQKDGKTFANVPTTWTEYNPQEVPILIPEIVTEVIQARIQATMGLGGSKQYY